MSRKAILIGIDNYPDAPLKGCERDARELQKLLEYHGNEEQFLNFETEVYTDAEITTSVKLNNVIEKLFKGEHEMALLYFSGHGAKTASGVSLVAPGKDLGLPVKHILEVAAKSAIHTKIIILDCCYSGDAARVNTRIPDITLTDNTIILAASRGNEYAAMKNERSVFTNLLLEALEGGAADILGNITPEGVYAMIDKSLGSFDQRPLFMAHVDQFHVLRKVKPAISIKSLRTITEYFTTEDFQFPLDPTYVRSQRKVAIKEHIEVFTVLQQMNRTALVVPVEEKDMYWAAMRKKSCELTPLGKHYWRLRKKKRF